MDFVALDVETANPDLASICQIGLVKFRNGAVVDSFATLVDPEDYFDPTNVSVHGIQPFHVRGAPTWPEIFISVKNWAWGEVVVTHTAFDRASLKRVCEKYDLPDLEINWLDSARVARRAWSQFSQRGYGLSCVADFLGIAFQHHDAVEDARAAGEIVLHAIKESGKTIQEWMILVDGPVSGGTKGKKSPPVKRHGNPEGPLWGEVVVFTGELTISRQSAADLAASAGCHVAASVTKATTLLVVGDQDVSKLAGHEKSAKQRKAEQLISSGQAIRILRETDFRILMSLPLCD